MPNPNKRDRSTFTQGLDDQPPSPKRRRKDAAVADDPELMLQWHPNNSVDPSTCSGLSKEFVKWRCIKNNKHFDWQEKVAKRSKSSTDKCPQCLMYSTEEAMYTVLNRMQDSQLASMLPFKIKHVEFSYRLPGSQYTVDFAVLLQRKDGQ